MRIQKEKIHLRDYFNIIAKHRSTVITFFTVTFLVVLVGTFAVTPQYEGITKVMIEKGDPNDLTGGYRYSSMISFLNDH